jgi:flagellum-specific peptidoglycan hydrolase FlgJ
LISTSSRYHDAYAAARAGNVEDFASLIGSSGYATESDYATQILAVADRISEIQSA